MEAKIRAEVITIVSKEIEKHFPKKDLIEMKGNIETLTRHYVKHKKDMEDNNVIMVSISKTLESIEKFLVPHALNNNKGLVKEFSDSQVEIERLKGIINIHRIYFGLLGVFIISGGIITYFTKPFLK